MHQDQNAVRVAGGGRRTGSALPFGSSLHDSKRKMRKDVRLSVESLLSIASCLATRDPSLQSSSSAFCA